MEVDYTRQIVRDKESVILEYNRMIKESENAYTKVIIIFIKKFNIILAC